MAVSKAKKSNTMIYQIVGLIVLLIVLISVSTVATLTLTGTVEIGSAKGKEIAEIIDAEQICERRMRGDHGSAISNVSVDNRSSRFDQSSGQFKLYYKLDLYRNGQRGSGVSLFYVNCFVRASHGDIARIEYLEQLDFKPKAVRREKGNPFGFE